MLYVLLALVYANLLEWLLHKYVLHELGMKKKWFTFHWSRHHRQARKFGFYDPDYSDKLAWHKTGKEVAGLAFLALIHLPLLFVIPVFYATLVVHAISYYLLHRKSHVDIEWGKKWLRWHYDHHMGKDQNQNWCVTFPLWDYILGSRITYS